MEILQDTKFAFNENILENSFFNTDSVLIAGSIYDVFKVKNRKPVFLNQHIERVKQSYLLKGFSFEYSDDFIKSQINKVIAENNIQFGNIKMVFHPLANAVYIYQIEHHYPTTNDYANGVDTITLNIERPTPNIKQINRQLRLKTEALIKENKVYEIILINHQGYVTEGSKSNLFFIFKDRIITPPVDSVLPGITRSIVIDICKKLGFTITEDKVSASDIVHADAVFITGTSPEVLPVKKVNDFEFKTQSLILKWIMMEFSKIE